MVSPAEYFTYQFYTWESRGRGWYLFNKPVFLEPPYIPFVRQFPNNGYVDESKRPTIFSSLLESIKGKKKAVVQETELLDYETIEPFVYEAPIEFKAFQIKLPKQRKTSPEVMKAFLAMISQSQYNISFELIGNAREIIIQFVCNGADSDIIKTLITAFFPDHSIMEDDSYLYILPPDSEFHCVDFGLKEEFVRPISILKNYVVDPLTGIIGILENIKNEDWGGVQILFHGAVNTWANSIIHSVSIAEGKSFFQDAPEAPKIAHEKINAPLFGVTIRTFSKEEHSEIIENLSNSIIQASKGPYNQLIALESDYYLGEDRMTDLFLRQSHRLGMLLSAEELTTLLHFPSETIVSKKLFRNLRKTIEVPLIAKAKNTILGINYHNSISTNVSYNVEDRLKHTHIIGATGTGKSTLLAQLILQDIEQKIGIALFDPHGDLVDDVIARLPQDSLERVVIIDPSDTEYPIGLNILHAHNDLEKEVLSSDLVASFRRLSTSWGDQMNTVFANAILAILEHKQGGTLNDLRRFLVEPLFRKEYLKDISDPSILYYWFKEYPLLKTNSIGPILTRLDTFLRPRIIRNLVSQKTGLDFESVLNENKILLIKLPQGLIGKENSFLLGSLILSKLHQASFARQASQKRPPFFIYLDEFHNFITPSIKEMLSGVRKYKVGLILSHQDLQQLQREDTELLNSVLGNTFTRIVFRVGEPDAKKLQDGFADFDFNDMQNLGRGEAIVRIEQPKFNTSFDTQPLTQVNNNNKDQLYSIALSISRSKYTKPRQEIEQELLSSLKLTHDDSVSSQVYNQTEIITPRVVNIPVETPIPKNEVELKEPIPEVPKPKETTTHKYLQNLVKKFAESYGYTATIEAVLEGQDGNVDVLLKKNEKSIAVEICVTTDVEWEIHNIEKCIKASYDTIVSLSGDPKQLSNIQKKFIEKMNDTGNVLFFTPDAFFDYLGSTNVVVEPPGGTTMKGYRINVAYDSLSHSQLNNKKAAITNLILNSMKKKNNK